MSDGRSISLKNDFLKLEISSIDSLWSFSESFQHNHQSGGTASLIGSTYCYLNVKDEMCLLILLGIRTKNKSEMILRLESVIKQKSEIGMNSQPKRSVK
jgi:hypothetical protein